MKIDRNSDTPMYQQIYNNIVSEIIDGYLIPEDRLPSRRALCEKHGVSAQTVENAYARLVSDGYIVPRRGSGYYVSSERVWDDEHKVMQDRVYNFSSNGVETSKMPFAEWSRLMRSTIREDTGLFQHGEKAGEWCLRKSIRRLLFRTQGIRCRTEQIIIGPGAEDLLKTLFSILAHESCALMNNYYNYRVYNAARLARVRTEYIFSDETGISVEELNKYTKGVLYQKPVHDLPTGVTLDADKLSRLVEWTGEGRYIIEDSSEKDFIYGKREKTLWESSGGGNVIYLGSFSGTIAPSMKIGYIVMPDELVERWFREMPYYSNRVSRIEQVTLSKFIDLGHYEKHINYMKSIYRAKNEAAKKAFSESAVASVTEVAGDDAGMFLRVHFNLRCDEKIARDTLLLNGVKMSTLSSSIAMPECAAFLPNTYVVGYGDMTISRIREGIRRIGAAWKRYL